MFSPFEFIPIDQDEQVFLSIGGEVRQRYEYTRDPLFGPNPQDGSGVWLQRYTLHGDFHLEPHIRVFGQLLSALETGRAGGPGPVDENEFALQNTFVDPNLPLGPDAGLTLRTGRQELMFGSSRLVDVREGPNVRRTFDAARAIVGFPAGTWTWSPPGRAARVPALSTTRRTRSGAVGRLCRRRRRLAALRHNRSLLSGLPGRCRCLRARDGA